ncbi:MAG TPA: hypothetical protein VHV76_03485 [Mycobacteriales bacterium]|jgi:hypothetical protein|nr:hypothetical protein [Mycobacteriales bacterium]
MTDASPTPVEPKSSENDPPAANRPVAESPGSPEPKPVEVKDAAGRAANDPSSSPAAGVTKAPQVPPGKPDGEVDTRA